MKRSNIQLYHHRDMGVQVAQLLARQKIKIQNKKTRAKIALIPSRKNREEELRRRGRENQRMIFLFLDYFHTVYIGLNRREYKA